MYNNCYDSLQNRLVFDRETSAFPQASKEKENKCVDKTVDLKLFTELSKDDKNSKKVFKNIDEFSQDLELGTHEAKSFSDKYIVYGRNGEKLEPPSAKELRALTKDSLYQYTSAYDISQPSAERSTLLSNLATFAKTTIVPSNQSNVNSEIGYLVQALDPSNQWKLSFVFNKDGEIMKIYGVQHYCGTFNGKDIERK
jgi:hypothetical protein